MCHFYKYIFTSRSRTIIHYQGLYKHSECFEDLGSIQLPKLVIKTTNLFDVTQKWKKITIPSPITIICPLNLYFPI